MSIETIRRLANISEEEARAGISARFPDAQLVSFKREGRHFVAEIKEAEFPFKKDEESADDAPEEAPTDDAPAEDAGDDGGEDAPDDADAPTDDAPDTEEGGDADKSEEEGKPTLDKVMHMLTQIAEHLHIPIKDELGHDEHDPHDDLLNGEGLDTPDIGAPPADEPMPPAGPAGGALPPPVPEPAKQAPGMAFSHVLQRKVGSRRSFVARRNNAGTLSNTQIMDEAVAGFPGYRVARVNRDEDGSALVALVAKH